MKQRQDGPVGQTQLWFNVSQSSKRTGWIKKSSLFVSLINISQEELITGCFYLFSVQNSCNPSTDDDCHVCEVFIQNGLTYS